MRRREYGKQPIFPHSSTNQLWNFWLKLKQIDFGHYFVSYSKKFFNTTLQLCIYFKFAYFKNNWNVLCRCLLDTRTAFNTATQCGIFGNAQQRNATIASVVGESQLVHEPQMVRKWQCCVRVGRVARYVSSHVSCSKSIVGSSQLQHNLRYQFQE